MKALDRHNDMAKDDLQISEETMPAAVVDPESLVQALRYLQRRIPEFIQLSLQERRSMTRAAHLDPEFMEVGIQTGSAWPEVSLMIGRTGEELRQEADVIRRWDEVEREMRALTEGIAAANLKRKHRLGDAILEIYFLLGMRLRRNVRAADTYLRPYYEEMRRVYLRTLKKRKRKPAGDDEPETRHGS